jgi:hypothetical protein
MSANSYSPDTAGLRLTPNLEMLTRRVHRYLEQVRNVF